MGVRAPKGVAKEMLGMANVRKREIEREREREREE